jgi:LacI family transcriptional regulator, repressor for deo operon, udp, cdd, tsx, nupC, and nupG
VTGNSLDDVANRAGVSAATVSRALRGLPGVAEGTRARVLATAAELAYVISPSASRLASGRTRTVGLVVPYVNRWFFSQVITGFEEQLRLAGYDLLLYNLGDDAGRERFFAQMPLRRRVDAVLVLCLPMSEAEVAILRSLDVPLGIVGAEVDGFVSVRIDDLAGASSAVQHLVNLGHRDIGLISAGTDVPMHFTAPVERRRAYLDVLAAAGIDYDHRLESLGDFTTAGGERAMSVLLGRPRQPTAVFALSDEMAFGAMKAIRRAGLRVPRDISVIGFDDHDMADLLDLTTIAQPVLAQGQQAGRMLMSSMTAGARPTTTSVVFPTTLVVRGSTAPPATARDGRRNRIVHAPSLPVAGVSETTAAYS